MKKTINADEIFQVDASLFIIGHSSSGYTLYFSADGSHWTAWTDGTLANTDQVVSNAPRGTYFKLYGNTDTSVDIVY